MKEEERLIRRERRRDERMEGKEKDREGRRVEKREKRRMGVSGYGERVRGARDLIGVMGC